MKRSRLKIWQKAVKDGRIDLLLWSIHFPVKKRPDKLTCRDCVDFEAGICRGGSDPIKCFMDKKVGCEWRGVS